MEPAHLLGTGGAIGAVLRYAVGQWLGSARFPVANLVVNVVGSFVLALVVFTGLNSDIVLFVGVGVCGSFTTYSSFSAQTVQLWETGDRLRAAIYAVGTFGLCVVAAGVAAGVASILHV